MTVVLKKLQQLSEYPNSVCLWMQPLFVWPTIFHQAPLIFLVRLVSWVVPTTFRILVDRAGIGSNVSMYGPDSLQLEISDSYLGECYPVRSLTL